MICKNCGSRLKRTGGFLPTEAPLFCELCGIPYNEDGTEFNDEVTEQ
jgi:predicted amidophosphoribosyltransferase